MRAKRTVRHLVCYISVVISLKYSSFIYCNLPVLPDPRVFRSRVTSLELVRITVVAVFVRRADYTRTKTHASVGKQQIVVVSREFILFPCFDLVA
jgi:hypothetical protein